MIGGPRGDFRNAAANDNPGPGAGAEARIEAATMRLTRPLGRQIAREHFEARRAANDWVPAGEADLDRAGLAFERPCEAA